MNRKKVNLAFFISIILYLLLMFAGAFLFPGLLSDIITNNLICELAVLLPGLLIAALSGEKLTEFLGFHKLKAGTALVIIPFTMFSMPFITLINLISQFWVKNEVASMMETFQIGEMPFLPLAFSIGIFGPFCEEVTCRGVFYKGCRRSASALKAMLLSALLFALIHMNINQALYAFAVGVLAVLLVEATGSLWASVLYHSLINLSQTVLMYTSLKMNPAAYSEASEQVASVDMLVYGVAGYLVITAVTLPLAWALLVWMSGHEGRSGFLSRIWKERKGEGDTGSRGRLITPSLLLGIAVCVIVMIWL